MSTERDDLAQIIHSRICEESLDDCLEWRGKCVKAGEEILAAGYRKPRKVSTVEEVNALPKGTIILDSDPDALMKIEGGQWRSLIDPDEPFKSLYLSLPATVLHEPAA